MSARVGLVGVNGHGRKHLDNMARVSDAGIGQFTAVCDRAPIGDELRDIVTDHGGQTFQSYDDMLDEASLDIVVIATPPHVHRAMACAAMTAGIDVLLDWSGTGRRRVPNLPVVRGPCRPIDRPGPNHREESARPGVDLRRARSGPPVRHPRTGCDRCGTQTAHQACPRPKAFARLPVLEGRELDALIEMLQFDGLLDENLRQDLTGYLREFYRALNDPASTAEWVSGLFPTGEPMRSLRDVEQQAPVFSRGGRS